MKSTFSLSVLPQEHDLYLVLLVFWKAGIEVGNEFNEFNLK